MRGADVALNACTNGVEAQAAEVLRVADLQATHERPHLIAKRRHRHDGFRLDHLHGPGRHAQRRQPCADRGFQAAIQNAYDKQAARLVGVGKDHAGQLEQRQETLVLRFESGRRLGLYPHGDRPSDESGE